ncbi:unnamed protein product [Acanthoscelides obtectus]|uniref:Uncharacterized protein n=1 Tax=Acanthoscelides obtectus TaxID=200917 RepID=A0A9P0L6L5_ACAOB|nr:unnamed protein product [Acanthoscelides obtectus]CAK1640501.1 hypothetical protein AOBTE_LOCUS11763 [Acanthoscelides obtectus]
MKIVPKKVIIDRFENISHTNSVRSATLYRLNSHGRITYTVTEHCTNKPIIAKINNFRKFERQNSGDLG